MALISDDTAADSLPVALAGTVIVIALIVGLAAYGIENATPAIDTASVDKQADEMANVCRFLLSLAPRYLDDPGSPPGACRIVELDLPEGAEYLSFGYDPESGGGNKGTIYYMVAGTKKAIVVDERAVLRTANGDHMILKAGHYNICIEYARDALGRYILLSDNS